MFSKITKKKDSSLVKRMVYNFGAIFTKKYEKMQDANLTLRNNILHFNQNT